jgi:hypothetical protein
MQGESAEPYVNLSALLRYMAAQSLLTHRQIVVSALRRVLR